MQIYFILVFFIVICLVAISWIWPPNSPWAPWWRTKKNTARAAFKLANLSKDDVVYELGSGEATALIIAVKEFGARGVGIEIEPFRLLLSKLTIKRNSLENMIYLKKGNFFDENLSEASVVYVYLVPKTLSKLIPKFKKELKKGTKIISYKYSMNLPLKKEDKTNQLKLYVV